jgi:riboflavin kinase/FMN adenylyltransferase
MHIHYLGQITNKQNTPNKPLAITIGNFDGIHIGHQQILDKLSTFASKNNMQSAVLSFYPHPKKVLANVDIEYIDTLRIKISKILTKVNNILLVKFTKQLAQLSAKSFVEELYKLNVKYIIVGDDFYFGNKRSANAFDLKEICQDFGIQVDIIKAISNLFLDNIQENSINKISSTTLRQSLKNADLTSFKQLTSQNFYYINRVSKGKQIGRTIGFPTINLKVPQNFILPSGIYAVYVEFLDIDLHKSYANTKLHGVASLGYRPTVEISNKDNQAELLLEVHVLNWQDNVYGKKAKVTFLQKIRDEKFYPNLEQMTVAIHDDIQTALQILLAKL